MLLTYIKNPFRIGLKILKIHRVLWRYHICDLNGGTIVGTFYEKKLQKTKQEEFRAEKVIKNGKAIC